MKTKTLGIATWSLAVLAVLATLALGACRRDGTTGSVSLDALLSSTSREANIPGMAVAFVTSEKILTGRTGIRKQGAAPLILADDRFHLGSNIKAMTATLAALMVEGGSIQWTTTLAQAFPEQVATMRAEYRDVTLAELLAHRGGILPLTEPSELANVPSLPDAEVPARAQLTAWLLQQPSAAAPHLQSKYSNAGYAVAAAMLERRSGQNYETLLADLILRPLGIVPQFDWPAAGGAAQPLGHEWVSGRWLPNDPQAVANKFPVVLNPAGNISLSIGDYARFIQAQLRGLRGRGDALSPAGYQLLHTPNGEFALGWVVRDLAGVRTSAHDGSAGTFYAIAAIQASRDRAVIVLCNAYSEALANASNKLALQLLELAP
jgi:CubicO group peptidase (beta-lactamase class C family)